MHEVERAAVVEETKQQLSRKRFLFSAAGVLGGGAIMAAFPGVAKAHETEAGYTDREILNYALTLEHLEAAFYNQGVKKFKRNLDNRERKNFQRIRAHENTHVDALIATIEAEYGEGSAVPPLTYDFKFTGIKKFLATAQLLENTGVSAYDGAIAHIAEAEYLTTGATIATVEARHAAYLNDLNGDVPFPDAFDEPVAPTDIIQAVVDTGFVTGTPEPYGPYDSFQAFVDQLPDTTQPDLP
jgi:rubrerythrin